MLKEHLAILFACYFMSNFFLVPVFCLNLSGLPNLFAIPWQVRLHKCAVILALVCPILIYVYSEPYQALDAAPVSIPRVMGLDAGIYDQSANDTYEAALYGSRRLLPGDTKSMMLDGFYFLIEYFLLMSLAGGLYFCFRFFSQCYVLTRIEKHCRRRRSYKNLDVFFSSKIPLPFSVGIFHRKVYLPDIYTPSEYQIIINHEFNHFRRHHHLWTILESILHYLFWYNPISYYLRVKGIVLREIECDAETLKKTDVHVYCRLLIKTAESSRRSSALLLTQRFISRHTLKKRIAHMLKNPISKKHIGLSVLVAVALIMTVVAVFRYGIMNDQQSQSAILNRIKTQYAIKRAAGKGVEIDKVPQHFIDALLVKEDRDFFKHKGVKMYNSVKAAVHNLFHDREHWLGASTITQQLAKHFLNGPRERTWKRKIRELKIAKVLEKNFSKVDILEMYLNSVYFGNDAWGLAQAAQKYFGHSYETLTLKESALLVPSLVAPSVYNAIKNPEMAKARQERLLDAMAELGVLPRLPEK